MAKLITVSMTEEQAGTFFAFVKTGMMIVGAGYAQALATGRVDEMGASSIPEDLKTATELMEKALENAIEL